MRRMPWARAMAGMKSGNLDMILTIFYTSERARFMSFTIPYVDIPTVVFVLKGNELSFNKDADLIGQQGLMQRGDSLGQRFDTFLPRLTLTEIASYEQIIKMLLSGRRDYAIGPKYEFFIELKRLGHDNKIHALPRSIDVVNLHFAFSKKSLCIKYIPLITQRIKQFKKNGYIDKMIGRVIQNVSQP
ncbi:substrate-binding periplasmic protein [Desulfocicer niacini]